MAGWLTSAFMPGGGRNSAMSCTGFPFLPVPLLVVRGGEISLYMVLSRDIREFSDQIVSIVPEAAQPGMRGERSEGNHDSCNKKNSPWSPFPLHIGIWQSAQICPVCQYGTMLAITSVSAEASEVPAGPSDCKRLRRYESRCSISPVSPLPRAKNCRFGLLSLLFFLFLSFSSRLVLLDD